MKRSLSAILVLIMICSMILSSCYGKLEAVDRGTDDLHDDAEIHFGEEDVGDDFTVNDDSASVNDSFVETDKSYNDSSPRL